MKTVVDRSPLNPVLVLPTYEPVGHLPLLAVIPLDEERVLGWLGWFNHWDAMAQAEPMVRSLTFADDTVDVVHPNVWQGDGARTERKDLEEAVIADARALGTDYSVQPVVYDAEREIRRDHIRWGVELKGAPYRINTTGVSRVQLLSFLCRVCSNSEFPRRFADLIRSSATIALDFVEHGARLIGEPAGSGRRLDQVLTPTDFVPALESVDPDLRLRAIGLLGQLR